jgi:2-keto-4-pentenoate hydratase/2-oxohepta-3-ene-1,7-dioic acid hydratase in catechol pathway
VENLKYSRIKFNNQSHYAEFENGKYYILEDSYFNNGKRTGEIVENPEVLVPIDEKTSKIIAIGKNYRGHIAEIDGVTPSEPLMFLKPNTTLLPNKGTIIRPAISNQVDFEAELAVVIGKTAKDIDIDQYKDYIFGFTCANDVTARDLQRLDGQWTRAKGFDTFLPLGAFIVKEVDFENLDIKLILNGEIKQHSNTNNFIFSVAQIIKAVSQVMTLYAGDIILTGTPEGIGEMKSGDVVTVEIEGIGKLTNEVK